ncbi:hypothetical protein ABIE37_001438 [Arthrobacter bambusae]|uniref:Uncharacterized protein n=1 Tax=Arthrobacter bambusae TaxID=1338426 RepID=A0ABV2P4G8_9MICC
MAGAAEGEGTVDGFVGAADAVTGCVVPGGEEEAADGVASVEGGTVLPLPLEQPDAMASKAPAVAMLTPKDAILWVLRMVNR